MVAVVAANQIQPILETVWATSYAFGLGCNTVLNIFGPFNILVRLLRHRHSMRSGRSSTLIRGYGSISGILLECGALNIPVTFLTTALGGNLLILGTVIAVHGQVWFDEDIRWRDQLSDLC